MIRELTDGMRLYHGSYCEVRHPDLAMCVPKKDFGKGFYLTTDREQACQFARLTTKKALINKLIASTQSYGFVSSFAFNMTPDLLIKVFPSADIEWLHCIAGHRKNIFEDSTKALERFDIIGGKIANDATNATLLTYMGGTFGEVGSQRADEICISLLLPERLHDQYCFRTRKALEHLLFVNSEHVCL